jgi:hypothetical protein
MNPTYPHTHHRSRLAAADVSEDVDTLNRRLDAALDGLASPSVELTIEEVAPILNLYHRLRLAGAKFDRRFTIVMDKLLEQAADPQNDGDFDAQHFEEADSSDLIGV